MQFSMVLQLKGEQNQMKIETKYKPGEYVWVMYNNKPEKAIIVRRVIISRIDVNTYPYATYTSVEYFLHQLDKYDEEKVFKTKEDLIKSL